MNTMSIDVPGFEVVSDRMSENGMWAKWTLAHTAERALPSVKQNISPNYEMMGPFSSSLKPKQPFLLKNTDISDLFGDENFHF